MHTCQKTVCVSQALTDDVDVLKQAALDRAPMAAESNGRGSRLNAF